MRNSFALICAAALLLAGCGTAVQEAANPIAYTDIPDSDIIRVGKDYYMVSTTMYFCPGAPIMHSRDLVHWRIVSYVYDLLEDDDHYNLRDGQNAYGKGQWATSLRYHDGTYYALFVANDQKKSYLYHTKDIINGPWERTVFDNWFCHDPSLLFDDGRLFVVWGNGEIRLVELEPDGSALKGEEKLIIDSPKEGWMLRAEGSHLYHIGDYYYILEIDWPWGGVRQATCWRSKSIEGPYESKLVLCGTLDGLTRNGIAQGPLVGTPKGDWYAIQFQDHGAVGRIPTLQPVTWVDGWPIMGDDGKPLQELTVNLPEDKAGEYLWDSDEFDSTELALVWQWNHKPPVDWSLMERPGWMRLKAHPAEDLPSAVGTLTQRTVGPRCHSEVLLDVSALEPGSEAGLCAFQSRGARVGVEVAADGTRSVVLKEKENTVCSAPLGGDTVLLAIDYIFLPDNEATEPDTALFSWSTDGGKNWEMPDYQLHMRFTLDYFTGYRSGLYCFGAGGHADFDYFHQKVF